MWPLILALGCIAIVFLFGYAGHRISAANRELNAPEAGPWKCALCHDTEWLYNFDTGMPEPCDKCCGGIKQ